MSTLPGYDLEDFLAWSYGLVVVGQGDTNPSLKIAESLGISTNVRPRISEKEFKELVTIFQPIRNTIEDLLLDFNEETQSWRDYVQCFENYIPYHMTRKAASWMVTKGYWRKEEMKVINLPSEYPLLISGLCSTYKTTMALLIAYQEALMDRYNPTDIVIVTKELSLAQIPLILSRYIKDFDIARFTEDNGKNSIVFHVTDSSDFRPKGNPRNHIYIFDEPTVTEALINHADDESMMMKFQDRVNNLTIDGAKVIICAQMSVGVSSDTPGLEEGVKSSVVKDLRAHQVCKSFVFTSLGTSSLLTSIPVEVKYLDKFPYELM